MILGGWKEIADYLRCGVRTVQRWEENGLPVHRPVPSKRAHVVAYSQELDWWIRDHQHGRRRPGDVIVSIANAQRLCEQARTARSELRARMQTLKEEMASLRLLRHKEV